MNHILHQLSPGAGKEKGMGFTMEDDLLLIIKEKIPELSKNHKLIARFIIDHYEKAAFMTAGTLSQNVGVSKSTVVRFASRLGFAGYPELQKALQNLIRSKLTAVQRIQVTSSRMGGADVLKKVLGDDIGRIRSTLEEVDKETFDQVVEDILKARKVYLLGVRSSQPLASFLGFYFNLILENVQLISTVSVSEIFEQIVKIRPEDLVIGISFPRYSKRTIKALQFAKDQGAEVIAITDDMRSPVSRYATHTLTARSDMISFVDSMVAPLSLINALIVAVSMKKQEEISAIFEKLEGIWDEYEVYEKNELK